MPANVSRVIVGKIEGYAADPGAFGNVVIAMQGAEFTGMLRMRVGDWRVLMSWRDDTLFVHNVAPRGEVYR